MRLHTYVVSEIIKSFYNNGIDPRQYLYYYRDIDKKEVDILLVKDGTLYPVEIKKSANPGAELASAFKVLDKGSVPRGAGAILCLREELSAIDSRTFIFPIWMI